MAVNGRDEYSWKSVTRWGSSRHSGATSSHCLLGLVFPVMAAVGVISLEGWARDRPGKCRSS